MTTVANPAQLRGEAANPADIVVRATDDVAQLHDWMSALTPDGTESAARLAAAAGREGAVVVTAAAAERLVGCGVAGLVAGAVHVDPVIVAPNLSRLESDEVCGRLAVALLDAVDRPWADVAVPPASPLVPALLRAGWRRLKTAPDAPYDLLSGADAA